MKNFTVLVLTVCVFGLMPAAESISTKTSEVSVFLHEQEIEKDVDSMVEFGDENRDPFIPLISLDFGLQPPNMDRLTLKGIIKTDRGNLAIVADMADHAFLLRAGDQVGAGKVKRVNDNKIVFEVNVMDFTGRITDTQEKRLFLIE